MTVKTPQGLMLHCGAQVVDFSDVEAVETPEATKSWQPIPHHELVNMVIREFDNRGIEVLDSAHCLGRKGGHYFGLFEVTMPMTIGQEGGMHNLVIGLRNSHMRDLLASLVGGGRVFVCDNLCLSGEINLGHKHTKNILDKLPGMIGMGLSALNGLRETQEERIQLYQQHVLTPDEIVLEAVRMSQDGKAFTWGQTKKVLAEVQQPSYDEHLNNDGEFTAWTLQNAVTEALKQTPNPHTLLTRSSRTFQYLDALTGFVSSKNSMIKKLSEAVEGTDIVIG